MSSEPGVRKTAVVVGGWDRTFRSRGGSGKDAGEPKPGREAAWLPARVSRNRKCQTRGGWKTVVGKPEIGTEAGDERYLALHRGSANGADSSVASCGWPGG